MIGIRFELEKKIKGGQKGNSNNYNGCNQYVTENMDERLTMSHSTISNETPQITPNKIKPDRKEEKGIMHIIVLDTTC
ncbi:hypothetical protein MTBBW1_2730001 [Desulfamplus magnetovallimortis]|uniref:Uncharacterized protein n=1 Tax=Desulfamplus magnetovallimortis TaxID=1246637 RepID=A0A1W1HF48_9BACT|nr:hypothetical protein [Desulfamplus magnetovallimortis]SLM31131.1 hypothetical protein MTBBW1_2730001 [Desulfamplus magnetovallimortis]